MSSSSSGSASSMPFPFTGSSARWVRGDQLGEHSRQSVDLVAPELGSRRQARGPLGEDPLEAEHEREANLPLRRGLVPAGFDLRERIVQRAPAGSARREHLDRVLAVVQERLADPIARASSGGDEIVGRLECFGSLLGDLLHLGGVYGPRFLRKKARSGLPRSSVASESIADRVDGTWATEWREHFERERSRYADGESRLPEAADSDARQRQLTRMANAAAGAGLALLMLGRSRGRRLATARGGRYRESSAGRRWEAGAARSERSRHACSPATSGRAAEAESPHAEGAAEAESPIGRYAATLALLVLDRDDEARPVASSLRDRDDFPATSPRRSPRSRRPTASPTSRPSRACWSRSKPAPTTSRTSPSRTR